MITLLMIGICSCNHPAEMRTKLFGANDLHQLNRTLLEIAMEDGFPPPIASRVYVPGIMTSAVCTVRSSRFYQKLFFRQVNGLLLNEFFINNCLQIIILFNVKVSAGDCHIFFF